MKVLIDTNVLSEIQRPGGHPNVRAKLATIADEDQFISVISIGEIACGIAKLEPGKRRGRLEQWLGQTEQFFADHIIPIDRDIAQLWGELTAKLAKAGRVLHTADGLIAATALHHGLCVMTRNIADFEPTGLRIINPLA